MKSEKIIVKREAEGNYIIFFPYTDQENKEFNAYEILCYTHKDGHNNAMLDYMRKCKPVGYTDVDVVKFVTDYVKYVRTLPDMADYTIKMVKRIRR